MSTHALINACTPFPSDLPKRGGVLPPFCPVAKSLLIGTDRKVCTPHQYIEPNWLLQFNTRAPWSSPPTYLVQVVRNAALVGLFQHTSVHVNCCATPSLVYRTPVRITCDYALYGQLINFSLIVHGSPLNLAKDPLAILPLQSGMHTKKRQKPTQVMQLTTIKSNKFHSSRLSM